MPLALTPLAELGTTEVSTIKLVGAVLGILLLVAAIRSMFGRKR